MRTTEIGIACRSDATVLITGPTGSGKTRLAREIHEKSRRRSGPFVTVNLASLHEGTLESELFGHERGAFTSADSRRTGRLELAAGGTIFLDEIGELSPRLQSRLLEFLQARTVTPVGGNRTTRLDVRVIAATHRDLARAVREGAFREDLFHRLRIVSIPMPALAERPDDFDRIVHDCLAEACRDAGRSILRLSPEVADRLESHDWPGNIRELRNVLEYAVLSTEGVEITGRDLPAWFGERDEPAGPAIPEAPRGKVLAVAEVEMTFDYHSTIERFERDYITRALERNRWRINRTAREIGMNKTTFIRKMRNLGIKSDLPALTE